MYHGGNRIPTAGKAHSEMKPEWVTAGTRAPFRILFWSEHEEALAWVFENGGTIARIPDHVDGTGRGYVWGQSQEEEE